MQNYLASRWHSDQDRRLKPHSGLYRDLKGADMLWRIRMCLPTTATYRAGMCTGVVTVILFGLYQCEAQEPKQANTVPFQGGFPGSPEKLMESMFGPSTPEEEQLLAAVKISFTEERAFGQTILDDYLADLKLRKLRVVRKGPDVDYLTQLVQTIHPLMTHAKRYPKIAVYVVDSPDVDARSIPGGTLLFSKGLLEFAKSEAALIGIVGHELSHLDREHLVLPLKRTKILRTNSFVPPGSITPQKFATNGTMMMRLMGRAFRPEDEAAADRDGAEWAFQSGYDPRELADLFARLHLKNQDQKVPFGNFFRTHPYNEDRCAAISIQYEELTKNSAKDAKLYIGNTNLKQRVPKSKQEFAE